jgi:hypothetical protein
MSCTAVPATTFVPLELPLRAVILTTRALAVPLRVAVLRWPSSPWVSRVLMIVCVPTASWIPLVSAVFARGYPERANRAATWVVALALAAIKLRCASRCQDEGNFAVMAVQTHCSNALVFVVSSVTFQRPVGRTEQVRERQADSVPTLH